VSGIIARLVAGAVALALFVTLIMSWMSRGQEIARLQEWRSAVVLSATDATVQPDARGIRKPLSPEAVPAAIAALKRTYDNAAATLAGLSNETVQAKLRADTADKALANATVIFEQRFSSAEKRIAALDSRKPAANPAASCLAVTSDSKAAWEGWK
jgi:hypothetical protein